VPKNDYTEEGIMKFGNALSFILLIDKLRDKKGESLLNKLPRDYEEKLKLQIPEYMSKLLSKVIRVLLDKSGYEPSEANEIAVLVESAEKKEYGEMFEAVIESIREGREEALNEGIEKGIETTARNALAEGLTPEFVQKITGLNMKKIKEIQQDTNYFDNNIPQNL